MAVARQSWDQYITPGARKAFAGDYKELASQFPTVMGVESSQRAFEDILIAAGLGTVPEKPELERIAMDKPYARGSIRVSHRSYGLGVEFSEEVIDDELYAVLAPKAGSNLARSHRDAEERLAAGIYNNAFSTQLGYDGVLLINAAHVRVGVADVSNAGATDFTLTAIQAMIEHFMLLEDDRGLKIDAMADMLIHHPSNYWLVRETLRADMKPGVDTNDVNILKQDFNIAPFSYKYLTDVDAWFGRDSSNDLGPTFFWRKTPTDATVVDEIDSSVIYLIKSRFSATCADWRSLYASPGA